MVWESLITQQHCAGTGVCHTTEEEEGVVVWSMYKQSAPALSGWGPPSTHQERDIQVYQACSIAGSASDV